MQSYGKMYVADQRGHIETAEISRRCTFNFEEYEQAHKEAVGSLSVFNEEMIAGGATIATVFDAPAYLVIIPVTGDLRMKMPDESRVSIQPEQALVCHVPRAGMLEFSNPYNHELVSFLQIRIDAEESADQFSARVFGFDFNTSPNSLIGINVPGINGTNNHAPFALSIGWFDGRRDAIYRMKNEDDFFFVFVIAGAFEVEGRLLHAGDSLVLWGINEAELEALSNGAIAVVIEAGGQR